jgi:hypothetical protein
MAREREKTLRVADSHILAELRAMANACGASYYDILALNFFDNYGGSSEEEGCTSWIATGTATLDGETLLHKNRDLPDRGTQIVIQRERKKGKNAYTALTTAGKPTKVAAGINEHGLAVINNQVTTWPWNYNPFGAGNLSLNRRILENCDTVDSVIDFIDSKSVHVRGGVIVFVADRKKGAIIEFTRQSCEYSIIVDDVGCRTNHYMLLEGSNIKVSDGSKERYEAASKFLEKRKGSLTALDFNELSRSSPICRHNNTLFGVTFQIDKNHPGELSVMWTAIGNPGTAPYGPIHVNATNTYDAYENGAAWELAEMIREEGSAPFDSSYYLELEAQIMDDLAGVEEEACNCLEASEIAEAQRVLTYFDLDVGRGLYEGYPYRYPGDGAHTYITTYDFAGITPSNTSLNAYENDVDKFPFDGDTANRNDCEELTDKGYRSISASDDNRWETDDPGVYDEMMLWLEMVIDDPVEDITQIDFTFEGYNSDKGNNKQNYFYIYLLKAGTNWEQNSSWTPLGAPLKIPGTGTDGVLTRSLTSDFGTYIGADKSITWVVGAPEGHSDSLSIDYIKMDVHKSQERG